MGRLAWSNGSGREKWRWRAQLPVMVRAATSAASPVTVRCGMTSGGLFGGRGGGGFGIGLEFSGLLFVADARDRGVDVFEFLAGGFDFGWCDGVGLVAPAVAEVGEGVGDLVVGHDAAERGHDAEEFGVEFLDAFEDDGDGDFGGGGGEFGADE